MQNASTAKIARNILSVVLITIMMIMADITGDKEYIFPEIGALCVGLWIVDKRVWHVTRWQIPILFATAALIGVSIVRFVPQELWLQTELGFVAVAVLLRIFDTNIMPVFPACMLPILMGTGSWLYPVVVGIATMILAGGQYLMERAGLRTRQEPHADEPRLAHIPPMKWLTLMMILLPMAYVGERLGLRYVLAPPLIVTLVEFSNTTSGFRSRPYLIWGMLVGAAIVGVLTEGVLHLMFAIPQYVGALCSASIILYAFHRIGKYFAPAVAIGLIPTIIPSEMISWFPMHVAIGAAYYILMAKALYPKKE